MNHSCFNLTAAPALCCEPGDELVLQFAGQELGRYLGRMLPPQSRVEAFFEQAVPPLRFDGYRVQCQGGEVRVAANGSRGILHGVYELLRALGCDFTFPGQGRQAVPLLQTALLPSLTFCREPWLEYRGLCLYNTTRATLTETLDAVDWMAKSGYNFLLTSIHRGDDTGQGDHAILWDEIGQELLPQLQRRGIVIDMSEHSTDHYFPREQLFTQHPEWFSLMNGQRCPWQICYANQEAVEEYGGRMADFVKDKPWFKFFGIWPLDGGDYCQCEACKDPLTIYRANRRIAQKLAQVRPDLVVEHLAYTPQSFARPGEALPKNMSVLVCNERGRIAWEWALAAKNSGGAFFFDYDTGDHYRWRSNLWLNPGCIKQTVNAMASYGYKGIVSLYLPVTCWWQASINYWYMRRFYYEPTASVAQLTAELCSQLFGAEAGKELCPVLLTLLQDLQDPSLWCGMPHKHEWYCEHITQRSAPVDEAHRQRVEAVVSELEVRLQNLPLPQQPRHRRQLELLKAYIALQLQYYTGVELYNAETDTPAPAEGYFALLEQLAKQPDSPFISAQYARWRITGRDNIFDPSGENAYQAHTGE